MIGQVIQGIIAVLQLTPTVIEAVRVITKTLEEESPIGGGAAQKEVVVGVIREGLNVADKFDPDGKALSDEEKAAVVQVAGKATDLMVGLYNTVGTFKKSGT